MREHPLCTHCGRILPLRRHVIGRPRRFCSVRCRVATFRCARNVGTKTASSQRWDLRKAKTASSQFTEQGGPGRTNRPSREMRAVWSTALPWHHRRSSSSRLRLRARARRRVALPQLSRQTAPSILASSPCVTSATLHTTSSTARGSTDAFPEITRLVCAAYSTPTETTSGICRAITQGGGRHCRRSIS
jgi:hypothetical protein